MEGLIPFDLTPEHPTHYVRLPPGFEFKNAIPRSKPWWRETQCCAEGPAEECACPEECACACTDCACDEEDHG